MKSSKVSALAACLVCSGICHVALGAVIELRDGTKLTAKLLKRTTTELHIQIDGLDLFVPNVDVKTIDGKRLTEASKGLLEARLNELDADDAEGRYKLALWAEKRGMKKEARELLKAVVELAPWHEEANLKLGRVKHNGLWWTRDELKAKGLVQYQGEWVTKDEKTKLKDKVRYLDQWVSKKDKALLEERKYSKWKIKDMRTHKLDDLMADIRTANLVSRLQLSKAQMRNAVKILAKAEAERQGFLDKRNQINSECEVAWLRLKEAAMHGVVDSFNVSSTIEGPAGMAEGAWIGMGKAYIHRMMIYNDKLMASLKPRQKQEIMYGLCGDCHCAHKTSIWEDPPQEVMMSEKYCARPCCHAGGMKAMPKEGYEVDQQALELVEKIRRAPQDQLDDLAKKVLRLYPNRGTAAKQEMLSKMKSRAMIFMTKLASAKSVKELSDPDTVDNFRKACGSGSCHRDVANKPKAVIRKYALNARRNMNKSMSARMGKMFGEDSCGGAKPTMTTSRSQDMAMVKEVINKIRRLLDGPYREQKTALADMIKGESELKSLSRLSSNDRSTMMDIMRPKKTRAMYTKYVLGDGRLFKILTLRLHMSGNEVRKAMRTALKTEEYKISKDIMFDKQARIKAGKELYAMRCCVCHSINKPGTAVKTFEEWQETLAKMQHMAYNLSEKECELICDFLASRSGLEEEN